MGLKTLDLLKMSGYTIKCEVLECEIFECELCSNYRQMPERNLLFEGRRKTMSGFPTTETAPVGTSPVQTGSKDTLTLLEEFASLNFMLHTHHPMTHVPVVDTASTQ